MSTQSVDLPDTLGIEQTRWRLDPTRSSIEFQVRHFYGLMTIKGRFERYEGTLDLRAQPAAQLTIDTASIDTKLKRRDKHLRSADFFDVENHPQIHFLSDASILEGDTLRLSGQLRAARGSVPLELEATVRQVDGELELEAVTHIDQRALGMTWNPLGLTRAPSKLIVRGRLLRQD
jgi:polyisoprenoid-binding protein YceI